MDTKLFNTIKKKIGPKDNNLILMLVNTRNYNDVIISLLKHFVMDKRIPSVYVNLNKPYNTIIDSLEGEKINTKAIIFIDCVTTITKESKRAENCLFLGPHQNLTDISIAISEAINAIPYPNKLLLLDSLNTLLIYNDPSVVQRFVRFVIGKIRKWNIGGVLMVLKEKSNDALIKELSQATDLVIDMEE